MNSDQKVERSKDQSTSNDIRSYSKISQFEINDESQNDRNISELKTRKTVQENVEVNETSISQFLAKTIINSKDISQEQESQYRQEIQKWFKDVRKVKNCKELLDVVTQCDNLKIVFDFESELVNNTAIYDCTSSGLPFLGGSISIGAKMSDTRREQEIKGVLARELCRYAICLTYENTYHKHDITATQQFDEIVKIINKWTSEDSDGLNRIISSVIQTLTPDNIQMELIATAVQILVQFNDDIEELTRFEVKFKFLFDYFENFVLPEMKKLNLKFREKVRKFNRTADILPNILSLELELSELKDVKSLTENSFSIIHTNFPKLLLFNIQKCLQIDQGNLFDSKNIFVSTENLKSQKLLEDYQNLLSQDPNLNIFVIFSEKIDENLKNIFACKSSKFTLIVSDESQCEKLIEKLSLNPTRIEVNYGWNDLTVDSQKLLLQMKINFQNYSEFSFLDILKDEFNPEDMQTLRNFSEIIDDQLLGLMLENSEISINKEQKNLEFFEVMFQERKLKKVYNESISQQELLDDIQKEKLVLILDKPGSGKSWVMKNIAKILGKQNPTNWITYVDLKQFTAEFKDLMALGVEIEFPIFMAESFLKLKPEFETKIFKKMYELGKVYIFLDGLDELGASCAKFITMTAKSFESNEGSQLWIATRDNIEVNVEQILQLHNKYKLDEMTEENCVDMIASSWMLNDIKTDSKNKLDVDIKNSENFSYYQKLAKDLLDKNQISKFRSIGCPQCCKMIAEITKDDKTSTTELTELKIFRKFTQILYRKWTSQGNSETENLELIFWTFHEILAMKSLFPNYSDFCDLYPENLKAWSNEDIAAGDLVIRNRDNYDFLHETFRDFFVAEFILRTLKKEEISSWFFPFLLKVLTTRRYNSIRMFLNQGFSDPSELKLSDKTVKTITANLDEYTNISYVFMENLENLEKFLVMCLTRRRYKIVKNILVSNLNAIFVSIKNSDFQINPQILLDFLVKFLNAKCLQALIKEKNLFSTIIEACEDLEPFEKFVNSVKLKLSAGFVADNFKRHRGSNILFVFMQSKNIDQLKIQKFLKILRGFMNVGKVMQLMQIKMRYYYRNILNDAIKRSDSKVFMDIWIEIENFFKANESQQKFKELIIQEASRQENILNLLAHSQDIKLHEAFWELSLRTFGQEELKKFIIHRNHYFFKLFESPNLQIIEFTFEKLQKIFNSEQFYEIMTYESQTEGNLLCRAAQFANNLKIFKLIWKKFIKNVFKSDEKFLKFVCNLNEYESNILEYAMISTMHDDVIFDFIISELRIIATPDQIKSLLTNINKRSQNILFKINCPKLFSSVWNVICEYLNPSEILEILQNCDCNGNNFILYITNYYSLDNKDLLQEMWNSIKEFINRHEIMSMDVIENIEKCEKFIDNHHEEVNSLLIESIKLKWLKTKELRLLDCPETLKREITKSGLFGCAYDFYVLANCENFEIHEISWEFILKKYENQEDLVKLVTKRSVHGSIFIHSIMSNKNFEVFKFILKIINDNFNEAQIREIVTIKCTEKVNLLSVAVRDLKNLQIVQILWTIYKKIFSSSEIFDIITTHCSPEIFQSDEKPSSNIILHAAASSADVFQFIWNELKQLYSSKNEKLLELVTQRDLYDKNILNICVEQHDIELLKVVWTEVKNFLGGSLKSIVRLVDENNSNLWYDDILIILEKAIKSDKIEFHEALWHLLWDTFKEQNELKSLILWKNDGKVVNVDTQICEKNDEGSSDTYTESDESMRYSDYGQYTQEDNESYCYNINMNNSWIFNFICALLKSTDLTVIKFTMENLNKIFTKDEIYKILKFVEYNNFLVSSSNCIERHQLMWDIFHQYLTLSDIKNFAHRFFSEVIYNAATISIEIFIFTWNEVLKEAEDILIPALENNHNIICACIQHKDKHLLKVVWTEVKNLYEIQNMPESFKEFILKENYSDNIFQATSKISDVEFHETFWELLLMTFEDREELKKIFLRKCYYGSLIIGCTKNRDINVVKFLVKILQETFTDSQLQEIVSEDASMLKYSNDQEQNYFEIFEIWWKFDKKVFQTSQKFVEFLEINDNFNLIIGYGNEKILELMFNDLETFMNFEEIKKNLMKINNNCENILHVALNRGNNFKNIWQYIHKYLSKQEILKLLMQYDKNGMKFLFHVITYPVEIIDITWNEMKKVLSYEDQIKCLKEKNHKKLNLYQCASYYSRRTQKLWIENIFREYKIRLNK